MHWQKILRLAVVAVASLLSRGFAAEPAPATPAAPLPDAVAPGAQLKEVHTDQRWFEGPSWDPVTKKFYFTSYTKTVQQMLRLDEPGKATTWWDKTEDINGSWISKDGRMLVAQCNAHKILSAKIGASGPEDIKTLYFDEKLNQPNDVREAPNGDIYFTDPDFKTKKNSAVYLLKPDGKATKIITDMTLPNGVIVSLDGKTLYVSDSNQKIWRAYPIKDDGTVGDGRLFFKPETEHKGDPDGIAIDDKGNLYCTGRGGVWVVSSEGKSLGLIPVKEAVSNVAFGGEDGKTLMITGGNKVWTIQMTARGALWSLLPELFKSAK